MRLRNAVSALLHFTPTREKGLHDQAHRSSSGAPDFRARDLGQRSAGPGDQVPVPRPVRHGQRLFVRHLHPIWRRRGSEQGDSRPDGSGPPVTEEFGYVYWFSYNWCEFTFTGGYADGALTVTGGQSTLRASGQLNGFNFNSEAVTVELDVTIDATGNYVSHGLSMYSNFTPYGSSRTRAVGTFAEATVSGSITVAGASVLGVISESYGTLLWANSGSVELWHP